MSEDAGRVAGEHEASGEPVDRDEEAQRAQRAERAAYHVEAQQRRAEQEAVKAQRLIDRFVARAAEVGLPTEELTVRPWSGRGRYRTGVHGWYLMPDGSVGVGEDGRYYVLVGPPRRFGRWRTVPLEPSLPPLQVGQGARDGESAALDVLLQMRLEQAPSGAD